MYLPFGAEIEKKPYWFVNADLLTSFKRIVAPITVSPFEASLMLPPTEKFWEKKLAKHSINTNMKMFFKAL